MARRNHVVSHDSKRYHDWLERAGEDIVCAGLLVHNDNCYNACAFHCQQTIEKALKAYILLKSDTLPDGHNLPWLCKRAMKYDGKFREWLDQCTMLNRCYIETRYPADLPLDLGFSRVMEYYRMARAMYLFICAEVDAVLDSNQGHPMQR